MVLVHSVASAHRLLLVPCHPHTLPSQLNTPSSFRQEWPTQRRPLWAGWHGGLRLFASRQRSTFAWPSIGREALGSEAKPKSFRRKKWDGRESEQGWRWRTRGWLEAGWEWGLGVRSGRGSHLQMKSRAAPPFDYHAPVSWRNHGNPSVPASRGRQTASPVPSLRAWRTKRGELHMRNMCRWAITRRWEEEEEGGKRQTKARSLVQNRDTSRACLLNGTVWKPGPPS